MDQYVFDENLTNSNKFFFSLYVLQKNIIDNGKKAAHVMEILIIIRREID